MKLRTSMTLDEYEALAREGSPEQPTDTTRENWLQRYGKVHGERAGWSQGAVCPDHSEWIVTTHTGADCNEDAAFIANAINAHVSGRTEALAAAVLALVERVRELEASAQRHQLKSAHRCKSGMWGGYQPTSDGSPAAPPSNPPNQGSGGRRTGKT